MATVGLTTGRERGRWRGSRRPPPQPRVPVSPKELPGTRASVQEPKGRLKKLSKKQVGTAVCLLTTRAGPYCGSGICPPGPSAPSLPKSSRRSRQAQPRQLLLGTRQQSRRGGKGRRPCAGKGREDGGTGLLHQMLWARSSAPCPGAKPPGIGGCRRDRRGRNTSPGALRASFASALVAI